MLNRTETSIANMAADFLDSNPIGNITENFGDAMIYARNYPEAVETVLAEFPWSSATARAILPTLPDMNDLSEPDMPYAYAWPSDCIAPIDINGRPMTDIRWQNETTAQLDQHGNVISRRMILYCDQPGPIRLRYKSFTLPRDMSPHLAKAIAIELAIRCEAPLRSSTSKGQDLAQKYVEATKGTAGRVGGFQVDTRSNRAPPRRKLPTPSQTARAGGGM